MMDNRFPPGTKPEDTRKIDVSIDIDIDADDVWPYLSTSEGLSAWYVGAEFAGEKVGDRCTLTFGPGMVVPAVVHAFEVGKRVALGAPPEMDSPRVEEYHLEKKEGGGCTVRIVNWGFGEGTDWDAEYEAVKKGWLAFLGKLKQIAEHFRSFGAPAKVQFMSMGSDIPGSWQKVCEALGIPADAPDGSSMTLSPKFADPVSGTVTATGSHMLRLRHVDENGGHLFGVFVEDYGGAAAISLGFTLFGTAKDDAEDMRKRWGSWFSESFPAPQM